MDLNTALSLVSSLYSSDVSLFGAGQRAKLEALLAEKAPIGGVIVRLLALDPKFDYVNPNIIDANFPTTAEPSLEGAQLENYGKKVSSESVLADLAKKGRRAATAAETLLYGIMNPEEQRKYWIVGLGQVWMASIGVGCVVMLCEYDRGRRASLDSVSGVWYARCRFLSFPL